MDKKRSPIAISLFSGGGGFDLGVAMAGFETRIAVEWEKYACKTLRRNQGKRLPFSKHRYLATCEVLEADIRKIDATEIVRRTKASGEHISLLIGGPPCISFSIAGRRDGLLAESGRLFKDYVRIIQRVKPKAFIFENVKGLLGAPGFDGVAGGAFAEILNALQEIGYATTWQLVDAANYGVPQHRHRVIILGHRGKRSFAFPDTTHADPALISAGAAPGKLPWRTVRSAIGDLPSPPPAGQQACIANHVARKCSAHIASSFASTLPGMRNPIYKRDRLLWDAPSKTIRAQGKPKTDGSTQKHGSHQPIHPEEHRQITVREAARIQSFPDWYEFDETLVNAYRVVGDAVPPRLALVIAKSIREQLGE